MKLDAPFGRKKWINGRWLKVSEGGQPARLPTRLEELETIIERGKDSFVAVGKALEEVRDAKLYKEKYGTFEEYYEVRWGFKKSHAYRLMAASEKALKLPEAERPKTERAMRKLSSCKSSPKGEVVPAAKDVVIKSEPGPEKPVPEPEEVLSAELKELLERIVRAASNPAFVKALREWLALSGL